MKLGNYQLVSGWDVAKTFADPNSHFARKCTDYLEEKDFLPLYGNSKKLPAINVFKGFVYYSGCVMKSNESVNCDEGLLERIQGITSDLDLHTSIIPEHISKGETKGAALVFSEKGSYMARHSEGMGIPRHSGLKARLPNLSIPSYRKIILYAAKGCGLDETDVGTVRKLERDSTAVLISARTSPDEYNPEKRWILRFFSRPNEKDARTLAEEHVDALNFAVPDLHISRNDIKPMKNESGTCLCYITLKVPEIDCIGNGNKDLLKFSPRLQHLLYGREDYLPFEPVEI